MRTALTINLLIVYFGVVLCQEACRTPDRLEGVCIQHHACLSFNDYFTPDRILSRDELNFLQQSHCGVDPKNVCCPDGMAVTTTTLTSTVFTPTPSGDILPNSRNLECGLDQLSDRIIGGTDTSLDEFPWFALLKYVNKKGIEAFKCGGSLINRRYVLTAAHCLDNEYIDAGERFVNIRLGEHDTAKEVDCDEESEVNRTCAEPPQNFGFEEIILHPGYDKADRNPQHDIALIRLERDAVLNQFVSPVCLPDATFAGSLTGRKVTIAGFGHTGRKRFSGVKQKAKVPIIDQEQCRRKWANNKIAIGDGQMCAGAEFNIDSCTGDSGGPLMSQQPNWIVEGIVSYGYQCGLEGWPGVYTRVSSYVDWIRSVVRA